MKKISSIFEKFLDKESDIFKIAINFSVGKKNGINPGDQFEENIKKIFDASEVFYQ
jgi:hypothetical protein